MAKFRDTVSSAIELTCNIAFDGAHTPRECFFRAVTILLCYALDKDWKLEEEMQGWGVGKIESQDSPPYAVAKDER